MGIGVMGIAVAIAEVIAEETADGTAGTIAEVIAMVMNRLMIRNGVIVVAKQWGTMGHACEPVLQPAGKRAVSCQCREMTATNSVTRAKLYVVCVDVSLVASN